MNKRGVIFDFDGTLADTLQDITDAVNEGLKAYGLPVRSTSDVRGWIGEGVPVLCQHAVREAQGIPMDELVGRVVAYYREHRLDKSVPYPGVPELLHELTRRGVRMAILSNKPHEHMLPMTEALFGRWVFVAVEGYRQEACRKPDPRSAVAIVEQMQLEPREVLMVGDSATDVMTALDGGMIAVGVSWGYRSRKSLIDSGARHLLDHPRELIGLV